MERLPDGRTSLWIAPSLLLAQYETSAEVTLFLEKDYVVSSIFKCYSICEANDYHGATGQPHAPQTPYSRFASCRRADSLPNLGMRYTTRESRVITVVVFFCRLFGFASVTIQSVEVSPMYAEKFTASTKRAAGTLISLGSTYFVPQTSAGSRLPLRVKSRCVTMALLVLALAL